MLRVYFIGVTICSLKAASPLDYLPPVYQGGLFLSIFSFADPTLMEQIPQELHTVVAGDFMKANRELRDTLFAALLRGHDSFQTVLYESDVKGKIDMFVSKSLSKCMFWRLPPYYRENYGIEVIQREIKVTRSPVTKNEEIIFGLMRSGLDAWRLERDYSHCEPLMGDYARCKIGLGFEKMIIDLRNGCGLFFPRGGDKMLFFPFFRAVVKLDQPTDLLNSSFTHRVTLLMGETSPVSWLTIFSQTQYFKETDFKGSPTLRALVYRGTGTRQHDEIYQTRDFYVSHHQLRIENGDEKPLFKLSFNKAAPVFSVTDYLKGYFRDDYARYQAGFNKIGFNRNVILIYA